MSTLRNHVQLIGRLGNDPQVKNFESGKKMVHFSLATNDSYINNNGEKVQNTQWHNIVVWGKKAEVAEKYLKKGQEVAVQGRLVSRSYESNGQTRHVTEINLSEMLMLDKKQD